MPSLKLIKKQTVSDVSKILSNGSTKLDGMTTALNQHFNLTKLSAVESAFEEALKSGPDGKNDAILNAIQYYQDILSETIDEIQTFERYITLHIPQMEDGNNFGVTVQMTVAKVLKETREGLTKQMETIPSYYSSRAEAVEKLGLAKTTVTTTNTVAESEGKGGKDGDENKSSKSKVEEEKIIAPASDARTMWRFKSVLALDVQAYFRMRSGLVECYDSYIMVLDNIEKNMEKLVAPKGNNGGNSMGMY
jgi:hypothetical protein